MLFRILSWPCNLVRRLLGWNSPSLAAIGRSDVIHIPDWFWYGVYLLATGLLAWEVASK